MIYAAPTTGGGVAPITVNCVPPSGSLFPVGVTTVSCSATDAIGQTASGTFQITVLRAIRKHYFTQPLLLPPNGMMAATGGQVSCANGIVVRNAACRMFDASVSPPASLGVSVTENCAARVELEISMDGGLTWTSCAAAGALRMSITNSGPDSGDTLYATEVLQLDAGGGTFPEGWLIRESPTKASLGETRIEAPPAGYMIDSFFDVFTEISTDGGMSWSPAAQAIRMELKVDPKSVPPVAAPLDVLPMPNGQYAMGPEGEQTYAAGIAIRNLKNKLVTYWMVPPPPGGSQTHTFDLPLDFQLSTDGGVQWADVRVPGTMTVTNANVREFDMERMYDLKVNEFYAAGGDFPIGFMIRENPYLRSEGGMTETPGGGYTICSFFDIFTEFSTDGGNSWSAASNGPLPVVLDAPTPPELLKLEVPPDQWLLSTSPV